MDKQKLGLGGVSSHVPHPINQNWFESYYLAFCLMNMSDLHSNINFENGYNKILFYKKRTLYCFQIFCEGQREGRRGTVYTWALWRKGSINIKGKRHWAFGYLAPMLHSWCNPRCPYLRVSHTEDSGTCFQVKNARGFAVALICYLHLISFL